MVIQENKVVFATNETYGEFMDQLGVGNDIYVLNDTVGYGKT